MNACSLSSKLIFGEWHNQENMQLFICELNILGYNIKNIEWKY